jgi:ferredoxin-fold anticodon binding domain-containing protein
MTNPVVEQFITFTPKEDNKLSYLDVLNINESCIIRQDNLYVKLENASVVFVEYVDNDIILHGTSNTPEKVYFTATLTPYGAKITARE